LYRHWRGGFYPRDLPQRQWLGFYSRRFDTVEVNNSFYRLPPEGLFSDWKTRVPRNFLFAVKASRYLTHMKKLNDPVEPLDRLFSRACELDSKLGPVLYQLPPQLKVDLPRLRTFLAALPRDRNLRHAVEFRHASWYDDRVFDLLEQHRVALCVHDMNGSAAPRESVGGFVYIRFHGTSARYTGAYSDQQLRECARWLRRTRKPAFVYFNNDAHGHAPADARRLIEYLRGPARRKKTRFSG